MIAGWRKLCFYCKQTRWLRDFAVCRIFLLSFVAGMPFPLLLSTLSFRLREAGVDRAAIAAMGWIAIIYALKWLWSPFIDHYHPPFCARRCHKRSWLLCSESLMMLAILGMAVYEPQSQMAGLIGAALLLALGSATHDIALDALRIEWSTPKNFAAMITAYQAGYRLGSLWCGAGALTLAAWFELQVANNQLAWQVTYAVMALSTMLGIITLLGLPESKIAQKKMIAAVWDHKKFQEKIALAVLRPLRDFFKRYGRRAYLVLLLLAIYKASDLFLASMTSVLYVDLGFSKTEVATIAKIYGVTITILGSLCSALLLRKIKIMPMLLIGAILSSSSNLSFAWLATQGHQIWALITVISIENFCDGIAMTALIAYISSLVNRRYTATQYALFNAVLWNVPKFLIGLSGLAVDYWGYPVFFIATASLGIPTIILVVIMMRLSSSGQNEEKNSSPSAIKI